MRFTAAIGFIALLLGGCGFASDEEIFSHCESETRKVIEKQVGPITDWVFNEANYDPETDPISEDDSTIREGSAVVNGKSVWFQCSVTTKGSSLEIDVRDATSHSTLVHEFVDF
jgi:hypothetical protein